MPTTLVVAQIKIVGVGMFLDVLFFFFESHNWHFCFHQVQRTPKAKLFVNIIITASCISSNLFVQMHRERVCGVCTIYIQTPRPGHDLVVSRETEKHIK